MADIDTRWSRICHRCRCETTDWEIVSDLGLRCLCCLCWRCYRAYRDELEEKGT